MPQVTPLGLLRPFFTDKCGKLLVGGKVFTYEANSLTPKITYADSDGLMPNTNPVILDKSGEADIYLDGNYRFQIFNRFGVLIHDINNIRDHFKDQIQNFFTGNILAAGGLPENSSADYNYLMQRLAQIAVDKGWDASFVTTASTQNQQQINDFGGAKWYAKAGGYELGATVKLANGDTVQSTKSANTVNPNVDMTGWVNPSLEQEKKNSETVSTADYGSSGKAQNIPVSDWYTLGSASFRGYANLATVQADYPHVTSATNTVDWAAAQQACNKQEDYGSIKIIGCLYFKDDETLQLKIGQRLYGLNNGWFINTNNGTLFAGALTGNIPEYGIYSDRVSGVAINAPEACQFEGFTLFGKGYTFADNSIDILHPADAAIYPTVGINVEKFILTSNFSIFYFGTAAVHKSGSGDYYSRYDKTEITRCSIAHDYQAATYNQNFFGCVIRQVPTPFRFAGYTRPLNYFGGSIEGFFNRSSYCMGIQPYSDISFFGTYFETFNTIATVEVFRALGGEFDVNFYGCTIYLNHCLKWFECAGVSGGKISSSNNRFIVSDSSTVVNPIIYNIPVNELGSKHELGLDAIQYAESYPSATGKTGSIIAGQKTLTVSDTTGFETGVRVHIVGAGVSGLELKTVVISRAGSVVTLRDAAVTTVSSAAIKQYWTPQYHQYGVGTGLSHSKIEYPRDYIPLFDKIQFKRNGGVIQAQTSPPTNPFNGGAVGSVQLVADGVVWNPSGRSDVALGAYPVSYRGGRYFPMLGSFAGSFTATAGTATTVANTNVAASSKIVPIPKNSEAATLFKNGWYISAKNTAENFVITFQTTALGTEAFDYTITD